MICSRCKKRPAVVFVTKLEGDEKKNEGLCMQCATELGITPAINVAEQFGISPEEMDGMAQQFMQMMENQETDEENEEGRTASFPNFEKLFGGKGVQKEEKKETKVPEEKSKNHRKHLEQYGINLIEQAKEGKIDRIIGRDKEIARVIQILNRRTKNNPCLIGEPGVGKTAVVEGLALKIADGEVPAKLRDAEVYLLDLTALVAGTQFRGQFESRIKALVSEVKKLGNIILFIDEVHNLVTAGDAEGSMNAANILKPALSRGEIQVIGATTFNEYRKHIEKDSALERRFQPVVVEEPTIDDSVSILKGIKKYYEQHHGVIFDDVSIRQAVLMSERYITDRFLPDKAIDLIDEAASSASISDETYNERYLKERELLKIRFEISELEEKDEINYELLAELRAKECKIEEDLAKISEMPVISISVDKLAEVIELWTGIPASKIKEDELDSLRNLSGRLKARVIGQDDAIDSVCACIKKNRVGISPKKKPASFIFTGPTGIGKTELVKRLSAELFDGVETLIRLDMSEFMEKHSVSRIIGSPPGYVGYDEAGQLTEKVRRRPYSVILFDEIEKAHPDVLNILLQILDDGRITDAHGRTVNFENTIIIMTSNAGSQYKSAMVGFNRTAEEIAEEKAKKALLEFLRPEFINRVDEIIAFKPLNMESFEKIAELMLGDLKEAMETNGRTLLYDTDVPQLLAKKSFSATYGAREIRRILEKQIENKIAEKIIELDGKVETLYIKVKDDEFIIES